MPRRRKDAELPFGCILSDQYDGRPRVLWPYRCAACGKDAFAPKHVVENGRSACSKTCRVALATKAVAVNCGRCGKEFTRSRSELKAKSGVYFCSRDCKDVSQRTEGLTSIHPPHYGGGKTVYRDIAFRTHGKRCKNCGYETFELMLDVHHVDGDRSNASPENLEPLCVWCHALKTRGVPEHPPTPR